MSISYKIKKSLVRFKQRTRKKRENYALKHLSQECLKVFNTVKYLAVDYNDHIKFDPKARETLIVIKKLRILVTLKDEVVYIKNTVKFVTMPMPTEAYELLIEILEFQAHRNRRKLKKEVSDNLSDFLDDLLKKSKIVKKSKEDTESTESNENK